MPLRPALFPLPGPVIAGSAHLLAVRADENVGRLQNHIETDGLVFADRHFRRRHLKLHHQSYEPVPLRGALEGGTPGPQFDRLRLANPDPARSTAHQSEPAGGYETTSGRSLFS